MASTSGGSDRIGADVARVDGRLKVTGGARYASDVEVRDPLHAWLCTSAIARGRIVRIDEDEARAVPGVVEILTWRNVGDRVGPAGFFATGGYLGSTILPLRSADIAHAGQIVAVVLAETLEGAREAAHRLHVSYEEERPTAGFPVGEDEAVPDDAVAESHDGPSVGDAGPAFAEAPVRIDARYATPTQHHNPIELFTTTCAWQDGKLTIREPSQNVYGFKYGVAQQLGIDPDDVRVISEHIGGAFGSRGSLTQRTALIALAARQLGRPVKLAATREQGFTIATYRAETRHRIRLGAGRDGHLRSLIHEGWEVTSMADSYKVAGNRITTRLYACPNVAATVHLVRADRNTPGFMRSPPEVPYMFALESAMDELAWALDMDPVELRRVNDTMVDPIDGSRFSSRSAMKCFDAAADAFGWHRRSAEPRSMRDGDWLVGFGCAMTVYPSVIGPAAARVTLSPDGKALVQTAAHDLGTGTYTAVALTAADMLGVPLKAVEVQLGDSALPPAPVAGGSNTTASVCNAVARACARIGARMAETAAQSPRGTFAGADPASIVLEHGVLRGPDGVSEPVLDAIRRLTNSSVEAYVENLPEGTKPDGMDSVRRGVPSFTGGTSREGVIHCAFGAEFVEVRVHRRTREIRCPRIVGAFAAGRIVSRRTAESQLLGGMIWGISSALHEATEIDPRTARYANGDLAEYLIPVNADIGEVKVMILQEDDAEVNPMQIKGLGELGNVGTNAAIANAVYHATGIRVRKLPIRIEDLL
ncbi:MAG: xanthine dehydrogenase family protein molybdopterin-binding subunit [Dehalococcoidia bacterium]